MTGDWPAVTVNWCMETSPLASELQKNMIATRDINIIVLRKWFLPEIKKPTSMNRYYDITDSVLGADIATCTIKKPFTI